MAKSTADVVSVSEAAKRMGRHVDTIKRWMRDGDFCGYVTKSGEYVIPRPAFDRYLAGEFRPVRDEEGAAA